MCMYVILIDIHYFFASPCFFSSSVEWWPQVQETTLLLHP